MHVTAPEEPLSDGVVTLRLPAASAGDIDALARYCAREEGLDDFWLPLLPGGSPHALVEDWLDGWAGRPSHNGPVLVVTIPAWEDFIGVVGFTSRSVECVEMTYGIAPAWRGRGLASRAARLGARWALTLPGVQTVEVRIGHEHGASQRVAGNAGFRPAGTVSQFVPGTGESFTDLRFVLERSSTTDPVR